jgi:hypothetical protein
MFIHERVKSFNANSICSDRPIGTRLRVIYTLRVCVAALGMRYFGRRDLCGATDIPGSVSDPGA